MAEETLQDRTEQATPKRREDARRKGQVLRSAELSSFAVLACSLLALLAFGPLLASTLGKLAVRNFQHSADIELSLSTLPALAAAWIATFAKAALPPALLVAGVLTAVTVLQVGWKPSLEALEFRWERLDFARGLCRLAGPRSWFQAARDVVKLVLIGAAAYFAIRGEAERFPMLADLSPGQTAALLGAMSLRVGFKITATLSVIVALDFAYQKYDFEKNLRMTRQEVKEESHQLEGDPQIRARIRQIQRQLSRRRMMADVATANVVVTRPAHLAVALRYRRDVDAAPVVVAKGSDAVAARIREQASRQGIPVSEQGPLATALYQRVKIGVEIPEALFEETAALLAGSYSHRGERS
jgi:flagellar biosynthesis protein FlhB